MLKIKKDGQRGIALLVAIGTMILIFIIAALGIYLITRGLKVASGQKRYQSAFEACEGGLEIGMAMVDSVFAVGGDSASYMGNIGNYVDTVVSNYLSASMVTGAALKFARGYFGVGQGMAKGGVNRYYRIVAKSIGHGGEAVILEVEQKKVIGID